MHFDKRTVWFLTENPNKFEEARSILARYKISIRLLKAAKVELQNASLEKIATFAAAKGVEEYKRFLIVEDSGLFIHALRGFPGPFSSYIYATIGLRGILDLLEGRRQRSAFFQCSVAVASRTLHSKLFTGVVKGRIAHRIAGHGGFGYDPIFVPNGSTKTFAETSEEFKNKHSHRAIALIKFARWFNQGAESQKASGGVGGVLK